MSFKFNADEILAMAEQIERNGARFYRRAAGLVKDDEVSKLFQELAAWEDGHEKAFASMRHIGFLNKEIVALGRTSELPG